MSNKIESMYKAVENLRDLGDGKKGRKVIVGDHQDARCAIFSFEGHIVQNRPSQNVIAIETRGGRVCFSMPSRTINGKKAYFFVPNELIEERWLSQRLRQEIWEWVLCASAEDQNAAYEIIREKYHPNFPKFDPPHYWVSWASTRIEIWIHNLNSQQLQGLKNLLYAEPLAVPAGLAMAA